MNLNRMNNNKYNNNDWIKQHLYNPLWSTYMPNCINNNTAMIGEYHNIQSQQQQNNSKLKF